MTEQKDSYVYIYFRPDGSPCYVGKGRGNRWNNHYTQRQNKHLSAIIDLAGGELPRVKIKEGITDAEACDIERAFIAAIGREANGGPLINLTDGGDGVRGMRHNPESRAKIAAAHTGAVFSKERRDRIGAANKGRKHSDEARLRMSAGKKNISIETRKKMAAAKLGTSASEQTRRKMSTAQSGRPKGDVHKAALKQAWVVRREKKNGYK